MRYLVAFLLIFISLSVNAQNRFSSIDSAKNYVLRYVKNSAVETFTNWRAQNVAYGTLELLDSLASDPAIDSIWKNGDTLRYSKASTIYTVGVFTTQTPTLQQVTTAGNITTNDIIISNSNKTNIWLNKGESLSDGSINLYSNNSWDSSYARLSFTSANKGEIIFQPNAIGGNITLTSNSPTNANTVFLPDTSGTLSVGVAANGTTYMAGANGITNIGNTDTATVVKAYVTNAEAVTITKGQVVYIFGAQGDRASVKLARNTSDTFSSKTLGIVREDIAAGEAGWITTQGQVGGINLGAYSPGDILWLDSVAGGFTATKPQAPLHSVFVGVVERAIPGNGLIYVKPANGVELDELHDVRITSLANNEIIRYNSSLGYWENKSITTTLGYTPLNVTDTTAMLSPYLLKVDTLSLSNRINAISSSAGISWTGIDSVFAKTQAENGFHAVEEFINTSVSEYAFGLNGGGLFTNVNYDNANAIQASTGISSTSSPAIRYKGTGGSINVYTPYSDYYVISTRVYLPDLNDGTQKYYFHIGAFNGQATNTPTQCAAFLYDLDGSTTGSAASANWQCVTGAASTRTFTTTSTAVSEDVWIKLTIVINNSNCFFYINNNLVATHTTNLPTNVLAPTLRMIKTAGIVARTFAVDYVSQDIKYSTAR
jgi:hypothetical protein